MALNQGSLITEDHLDGAMIGMGKSHEKTNVASFFLADSYGQDNVEEVQQEDVKSTMAVVILAGSFGQKLKSDLIEDVKGALTTGKRADARSASGGDARHLGTHGTYNLRGVHGKEHVAKGMVKLADTTVYENMVILLRKVHRLNPIAKNVYVVTNDLHKLEFDNVSKEHDVQIPVENIISNGAKDPSDRVSKVYDLQMAIEHFGITTPVLAISGDVAFYPDYNLQRLVEHALIRGKDACTFTELKPGEHVMEAEGETHAAVEAGKGSVTKCTGFYEVAPAGAPLAATPIFYIRPASFPLLSEYNSTMSSSGSINNFLAWFSRNTDLYALDLQFGYFDVKTLENLKFAEAFFEFYRMEKKAINNAMKVQDTDSSLFLKTDHSGQGDGTKYSFSDTQVGGKGGMTPELQKMCSEFVRRYFVTKAAQLTGTMSYKIPPTFYMTTYRQQVQHGEML